MKIALVHHCNYDTQTMTDKSWWFLFKDNMSSLFQKGDFVVTENSMSNGTKNLSIGWIELIKENDEENPKSYVMSRIVQNNNNFPKPMTETEYSAFYNNQNEAEADNYI